MRAWSCSVTRITNTVSSYHNARYSDWKDLFTEIGDKQSLLSSLKESVYFKPFADQASQIESKLALLDICCQRLNAIQRKWVYLEPIFGRGALPSEQARFKRVNDEYRDIMGTWQGWQGGTVARWQGGRGV